MKLTKEQVQHVANLARLGLSPSEIKKFQTQMSSILSYVSQLNEISTDSIEPTAQITGLLNVLRDDRVHKNVLADPAKLLECSPMSIQDGHIKVKSVF